MIKISPRDLNTRLQASPETLTVDILPDDHYQKVHIPNARNACIYEIDFVDKMEDLAPDKSTQLYLYGLNDQFSAARLAAQQLQNAGWTQAIVLEGGLDAWVAEKLPTEGKKNTGEAPDGIFGIDAVSSQFNWIGRNLFNQHEGTVTLQKGEITIDAGTLVSGSVSLNMNAIACKDIEDQSLNAMLINHLRSADFFLASKYPFATFIIDKAAPINGALPGSPNYSIEGSIDLRGITRQIHLDILVGWNESKISLQGQFELDRVLWGSEYGSGKIFEVLGKHIVNDSISLSFQLIANR